MPVVLVGVARGLLASSRVAIHAVNGKRMLSRYEFKRSADERFQNRVGANVGGPDLELRRFSELLAISIAATIDRLNYECD